MDRKLVTRQERAAHVMEQCAPTGAHTPGPWKYVPTSEQPNPYWHDFCVRLGSAGVFEGAAHNRHGQGEANARLIAAAPDLLAALEECEQFVGDRGDEKDEEEDHLLGVIRAAIAKARGE